MYSLKIICLLDFDWIKRLNCLKRLQGLIVGGAYNME